MSDPSRAGEAGNGQQEEKKITKSSSSSSSQQEEPNKTAAADADEGHGRNGNGRKYWRELLHEGPDRHIELLLTIAIATFACFQLVITCSNNKSTARQMSNLLTAADRINDAADSFSDSSAHINDGVRNAVGQLQTQAEKMDKARNSADKDAQRALGATIDNFKQDQRAWLGVRDIALTAFKKEEPTEVLVLIVNSGKTPALQLLSGIRGGDFAPANWGPSRVEQEIASEQGKITLHPVSAVPPGGPMYLRLYDPEALTEDQYNDVLTGKKIDYVVGKVTFIDTSNTSQWMVFCLKISVYNNAPKLEYCGTGNNMSYQTKGQDQQSERP